MIVRCLTTTSDGQPVGAYNNTVGIEPDTVFPVTPGREYPVYGITIHLGHAWYYIHDDDDLAWPIWTPASVFEVLDGRLPASWILGYFRFPPKRQYPLISFPEWASDHYFYERLVDGEPDAVRIYASRRTEVDGMHMRVGYRARLWRALRGGRTYAGVGHIEAQPMVDEIAIAVAVAEDVSRELDDDYVGLWVLPHGIRLHWPEASDDEVRSLTHSILSALTSNDVVLGDLDGNTGEFSPWSVGNPVEAAMEAWVQLGHDPRLGDIAWLVRTP